MTDFHTHILPGMDDGSGSVGESGAMLREEMEQGIRNTVDYVLSHPECQVEDPEFDAWCDKLIAVLEKAKEEMKMYEQQK